ncbi:hypothetical protein K435DRAFT_972913 [Dendrothele bispora CBS 962.96]|uniref:Uncharacterized protein n=1 Tax=Dendrothele bispora (strain CBS 962.96) TaxID=1314807 RepID=A0A4S8KW10_DENBC|nr:hypothetical protein K435DRAFT_972913 [Dendrothele bispora CBS 962.96]
MNVPYHNLNFSPFTDGTQANPSSTASGFHTSDARSTSSNLESHPSPHNGCLNCSSYHCKSDDEKFLRAMEEGRNGYRRRIEWIWYCISKAVPRSDRSDREQVWRTLVESDDIWSIWEDDDDFNLPVAPVPQVYRSRNELEPQPGNFDFFAPMISRKIVLHSKSRCIPKLTPSPFPVPQNTSVHMRLAIVLWKTLLATRRVKYPQNLSSVNCEIPSLIPKWWGMLSGLFKDNLIIDDHSWDRFRVEQKCRGHSCMEHLPEEKMWSTWITVQTLIGTSIPLDIPLNDGNCRQCLTLQKQPFGRSEFVKPHVLALWHITKDTCVLGNCYGYSDKIWDGPSIFSDYTLTWKDLDLGKSLFNQATLHKVDEWLTDIWSSSNDEFDNSDLRKHVGKTLDHIPQWMKSYLDDNEDDLEPHWTETETAISRISHSGSSVGPESDPVEPALWVSAVFLFTLAKIYGLGPLTAQAFRYKRADCSAILAKAPPLSNTPPSKKFHKTLKRSGHTCWSEKFCGSNSLTNLYFSAYSLLLGTSDVPVVGCDERSHWTKCAACHAKYAFHDLSLVLDDELLGPLHCLSDKARRGRVKRVIGTLNYARYQRDPFSLIPPPLNRDKLMKLNKDLGVLSNLVQYALDNGKDMDLFDEDGGISLGYGPKEEYPDDFDSESNPGDDTQSSSPSRAEISVQSPQPIFNQEEDTSSLGYLEDPAQSSHSAFKDNSSFVYHEASVNSTTSTQDLSQIQNISEGRPTLLHSPHPSSYPYALPESASHLLSSQPPVMDHQFWPVYTIQSHSGITRPTKPLTVPHSMAPQEIQNEQVDIHDSGTHTQSAQIGISFNASNIPNQSPLININWSPPPAPEGQTFETSFIPETGTGHNTKPPKPPRVDKMRTEIKKRLISMLESKKIQITGGKLPWRNLFKILQEHKCEFENWPAGTPEPSTQNGIEKAPQDEIKAIYKALLDKEHPLRIRRIDGQLGGADQVFISQDPSGSGSGNKRSRDEQGSDIGERESNRRRLEM